MDGRPRSPRRWRVWEAPDTRRTGRRGVWGPCLPDPPSTWSVPGQSGARAACHRLSQFGKLRVESYLSAFPILRAAWESSGSPVNVCSAPPLASRLFWVGGCRLGGRGSRLKGVPGGQAMWAGDLQRAGGPHRAGGSGFCYWIINLFVMTGRTGCISRGSQVSRAAPRPVRMCVLESEQNSRG